MALTQEDEDRGFPEIAKRPESRGQKAVKVLWISIWLFYLSAPSPT